MTEADYGKGPYDVWVCIELAGRAWLHKADFTVHTGIPGKLTAVEKKRIEACSTRLIDKVINTARREGAKITEKYLLQHAEEFGIR